MIIKVLVKPGSKKGPLVVKNDALADDTHSNDAPDYTVYIREKAHDGEANRALIKLLSDYFGVAKTKIRIVRGVSSHIKILEIS